jgi:hypothetical protein
MFGSNVLLLFCLSATSHTGLAASLLSLAPPQDVGQWEFTYAEWLISRSGARVANEALSRMTIGVRGCEGAARKARATQPLWSLAGDSARSAQVPGRSADARTPATHRPVP